MAHPDRVEATGETGEATVTHFDGDRDHGGEDLVDDCRGKNEQARVE